MHILISPNAFKNSLSSTEAARSIALGLEESGLDCRITCFGIGDGGDGTGHLIRDHRNGQWIPAIVQDPLGRNIESGFSLIDQNKTAIIELADAAGLRLLKPEEYNPLRATSYGVGELIRFGLDQNVERIILCIGGSATVDAGTGILQALGVRFLDAAGRPVSNLPESLLQLQKIDSQGLDPRLRNTELIILCDVENRLLGSEGAARVFGPQKGADPAAVEKLEQGLDYLSKLALDQTGKDMSSWIYGGAAGGIAAGLKLFLNARLESGTDYFLDHTGFDDVLKHADLLITGEGSIDDQSLRGKAPVGAARRAKKSGIPVIAMAGNIPANPSKSLYDCFDILIPINAALVSMPEALAATADNLKRTAYTVGGLLVIGNSKIGNSKKRND